MKLPNALHLGQTAGRYQLRPQQPALCTGLLIQIPPTDLFVTVRLQYNTTSNTMRFANFLRFRDQYLRALACTMLSAVVSAAGAANGSVPAEPPPTAPEIEAAITSLLMCSFEQADGKDYAIYSRVINHLREKKKASSNDDGGLGGAPFHALNVNFAEVFFTGWDSSAIGWGWSADGVVERLENTLKQRGVVLRPQAAPGLVSSLENVRGFVQITPTRKRSLYIFPGQFLFGSTGAPSVNPGGASVLCTLETPTNAEVERELGVPSLAEVRRILGSGQPEKSWLDKIINNGDPGLLAAIADYRLLDADQVTKLLSSANPEVVSRLIANSQIQLSSAQVDRLIAAGMPAVLRSLVTNKFRSLTPEQQAVLRESPITRRDATLRSGGPAALSLLREMLEKDDESGLNRFVWTDALSVEMVDTVLKFGSPSMRKHLAMNSKFMYTPEQIETMLTDAEEGVAMGVLRRRDLIITRAQFDRGINSTSPQLVFWYHGRNEFSPTAMQVEEGLTASHVPTRRGWAFDTRYAPTPEQTRRALKDREIAAAFLGRKDITLTAGEFDACTTSTDTNVRFACVKRADYPLTQSRFEAMATDRNSNVLRFFLQRKETTPPDLDVYIKSALANAPPDVLVAMAGNSALPLLPAHIAIGIQSPNEKVRNAYCRRPGAMCKR